MSEAAAVAFALAAVGSPYVYGATGKACTPALRRQQSAQYLGFAGIIQANCPVLSGKLKTCARCRYKGRPAFDCAQLVRRALGAAGLRVPSGATSQWNAAVWQSKQTYSLALASSRVCVLFRAESATVMAHVGLSLGDGTAVDARSHASGVVRAKLTAYPWSHLAIPRGFSAAASGFAAAGQAGAPVRATTADCSGSAAGSALTPGSCPDAQAVRSTPLAPGDRGPLVRALQSRLLALGYPLPRFGADGIFGQETAAALIAFQRVSGLPPTGRADLLTLGRLFPLPPPFVDPFADEDGEDGAGDWLNN